MSVFALGVAVLSVPGVGTASASTHHAAGHHAAGRHSKRHHRSAGYHPVTNYRKFVHGTAGRANRKRSTVYIGWINQQGGSADIAPETTVGAQIAVKYLNRYAGGVDGHPVKLVSCYIPDTVSSATACGQQMANDKRVPAIAVGAVAIGNEAMEAAISPSRKPIAFDIALATVDDQYRPGYALYGDGTHVEAPIATFAQKFLHAKSAAIVYENIPGQSVGADIIASALRHEHIKTSIVSYDPSNADLTGPLSAAGVKNVDLFIADVGGTACSNVYLALKQLDISTPVLVNSPCAAKQVAIADGGSLPPWYYAAASSFAEDPGDPGAAAFRRVAKKFGETADASDSWVEHSFGQILTVAQWYSTVLRSGKKLSAAHVATVARQFKGPVPFGAPKLVCGQIKSAPAVCNDKVQFFKNEHGVFHAIARWLGPPKGFVVPAA